MVHGQIVTTFHQITFAVLSYPSATETTSTTWTHCDQLAHIVLRGNSAMSCGKSIPESKHTLTSHAADICHGSRQLQPMFGSLALADTFSHKHNCVFLSAFAICLAMEVMLEMNV